MLKRRILLWKTTEGQALGLGLDLFDFILNSPPLTRDVTWSRLYFEGKKYEEEMSDEHPLSICY